MGIRMFVQYGLFPALLGWGAFAAVVVTGSNPDDLSVTRFLVGVGAWVGVQGAATAVMFLADRKRPIGASLGEGPDCERCGEPTGKPFLYNNPRQHWRCEPCEQEVTDIIFRAASEGYLTDTMRRYIQPLSEK